MSLRGYKPVLAAFSLFSAFVFLIDAAPGSSIIQEYVGNLKQFWLIPCLVLLFLPLRPSKLRGTPVVIFVLVLGFWTYITLKLFLAQRPVVSLAPKDLQLVRPCLDMLGQRASVSSADLPMQKDTISVTHASNELIMIKVPNVWNKRAYVERTMALRRIAKSLRHRAEPEVVIWNDDVPLVGRQLSAFLFQSRMNVLAVIDGAKVLARGEDASVLDRVCGQLLKVENKA